MSKVRTRFAPSPTGYLHIGGLRTALYGFLYSKMNGGDFILRIEDTDSKREVEGAAEGLIKTLATYGVNFDEGATIDGDNGAYGPYRQRQRETIYKTGKAFCGTGLSKESYKGEKYHDSH